MRETEELYRRLVELSPDGIFISRDARIAFLNPTALRLFGASDAGQVLGRSPLDFFHSDRHEHIRGRIARLLAGETVPVTEEQIVGLDGTVTDIEVTGTLFEDGRDRAIQVTLRDITKRKRADLALRASEEHSREQHAELELVYQNAPVGLCVLDRDFRFLRINERLAEINGVPRRAHLGRTIREILPHMADTLEPIYRRVIETGEPVIGIEVTGQTPRKQGIDRSWLASYVPVRRADGAVVGVACTVEEITDRKHVETALLESEERLRLAFAGAQEGVWDWDLETGAVVYSQRWKQMLGYTDDEIEPHVSAWERLLHPDDRARAHQVNESVARGEREYSMEFRLRHKDGHYVHVLSRGFPVRHEPGGPVTRIVGTHFDLTERKQTEEALRKAHEELERRVRERTAELARANESLREEMGQRERIERARSELLGRLVFAQEGERRRIAREMHDQFGEQLTALGLRIGILKEACSDKPDLYGEIEALEHIARQLDRDVDYLVWELRPTALDDLGLQAALANFVRTWSRHFGIAVELHAAGLSDQRLASEIETTLYRIAQEALNNIAKHSRAEHVEIVLERRSDHVSLVVEDDGVGFDLADATSAGRGLGLLGMQERAALVGATLHVESAVGSGTTILVRMPAGTSIEHA